MKPSIHIRAYLAAALVFVPVVSSAETQVPTVIHVHSSVSSGKGDMLDISRAAEAKGIQAVVVTDHLYEKYDFGIWPFKKTVERPSILKRGAKLYLSEIARANEENPDVLIIDGAAVTPFHYWSGNFFSGKLSLNERGKDFLVIGLGSSAAYESLPVTGRPGGFSPYKGDQQAKPYQFLIDRLAAENGIIYWSHPHAEEHHAFREPITGVTVSLETGDYRTDLIRTFRYNGFGLYATDVAQIGSPDVKSLASAGDEWDRLLSEYCDEKRDQPVWAIGEVDYTGFKGKISQIDAIVNMVFVQSGGRMEILKSLREGRLYIVTPASAGNRLVLDDFSLMNDPAGDRAGIGGEIVQNGTRIRIRIQNSVSPGATVRLVLIERGKIIKEWDETLPVDWTSDPIERKEAKTYYRLAAWTGDGAALVSNPVFLRPNQEEPSQNLDLSTAAGSGSTP